MDEPLPPYSFGELGELSRKGISYEILSEIFKEMGADFEIQLVPWGRAVKSVEHGKADGIPLLMKNSEREKFMVFSLPLIENREVFYFLKDVHPDFRWESFEDLSGKTIGLVNGYTYGDDFLVAMKQKKFKVLYSKDTEANFRKLMAGRVDFVLDNESSLRELLHANPQWREQVRGSEKAVSSCFWYLGVSRLSPLAVRIDEINRAIQKMQDNGRLAGIIDTR
ncbi:ABC transporter substrate-binding protein [Desulfovibrio sp. JC010]|uniref:substrate-binding periplasmic protein n=1 Tax=Desulfovibrio sp. JC010 TaxID=2593641 RepID=UPI0013D42632|nr:transporter substrate-binding domain-containing protein [Desulfovibrio sp. JC010]